MPISRPLIISSFLSLLHWRQTAIQWGAGVPCDRQRREGTCWQERWWFHRAMWLTVATSSITAECDWLLRCLLSEISEWSQRSWFSRSSVIDCCDVDYRKDVVFLCCWVNLSVTSSCDRYWRHQSQRHLQPASFIDAADVWLLRSQFIRSVIVWSIRRLLSKSLNL